MQPVDAPEISLLCAFFTIMYMAAAAWAFVVAAHPRWINVGTLSPPALLSPSLSLSLALAFPRSLSRSLSRFLSLSLALSLFSPHLPFSPHFPTYLTYLCSPPGNSLITTAVVTLALWASGCAILLATLSMRPNAHVPPRRKLRHLWRVLRLSFIGITLCCTIGFVALVAGGGLSSMSMGLLALAMASSAMSALGTRTRGRILRELGAIGQNDSRDRVAATLASFIGDRNAAQVGWPPTSPLPLPNGPQPHLPPLS